ncbi:MAG TPA: hypothetical protein VNA25_25740 [Phycisphaerae bacterium]|nr:hypothetical protein [Phycisphaerae bacterium]
MKARPFCWIVALLLACAAYPAWGLDANGPSWMPRETVTDTLALFLYQDGSPQTLAYDHHGNPGIVFCDAANVDLRYARRVPGVGWAHTVVDANGSVGWYPSLAYDRYERPAISYYNSSNGDLKFACFNGTSWNTQTVDSNGSVGRYTSLAFDVYGHPAIAYYDATNTSLKFVHDTDGDLSFLDETPVTVVNDYNEGRCTSMAFDGLNRPMVAHYDDTNDDLRFSVEEPGVGWVTTTVDNYGSSGWTPSVAINPTTGRPAIAYPRSNDLAYAEWDGTQWDITVVDSTGTVGFNASLAFDPADGNPAISYCDISNENLKFAWYDGSSWHTQTVDSNGAVGRSTSLAFNDYGTGWPSIAYFDANTSVPGHLYFIEDPPSLPEPVAAVLLALGALGLIRRRHARN